jgi:hypothetical protein
MCGIAPAATARFIFSMKIIRTLLAAAFLMVTAFTVRADETADRTELERIEKATSAALIANDVKALGQMFAAEWRVVGADASVLTREQMFKALETGALKFESYEIGELDVRIYGDAAVVIGVGKPSVVWKGEKFNSRERFTDVFIRKDGRWQCVSTQTADFPDDGSK